MKFIADSMLGRLARWLRLSGYDVAYANDVSDNSILEHAKSGRILLSKDKKLCEKAKNMSIDATLVTSDNILEQLKQVVRERKLIIRSAPEFSRCPMCNSDVEEIKKEKIKDRVPKTVFERISEFWECRSCGKIYWHGGHWKNIRERVRSLNMGV
ncbi:MAG: Mut7-C RNAse domain-containing protein [Euryarchaeota archaeon]|nr:Mut7-C RNAse domain-containing protein [Euryarchaeota archaeon]